MVRSKATITSKGQLTLPAAVRAALNVGAGDIVMFDIEPDGVHVRPEHAEDRFKKFAGKYRVGKGRSIEDTNKWLRELRGHDKTR